MTELLKWLETVDPMKIIVVALCLVALSPLIQKLIVAWKGWNPKVAELPDSPSDEDHKSYKKTLAEQRFIDSRIEHKLNNFQLQVELKLERRVQALREEFKLEIANVADMIRDHIESVQPALTEFGALKASVEFLKQGQDRLEVGQANTHRLIENLVGVIHEVLEKK